MDYFSEEQDETRERIVDGIQPQSAVEGSDIEFDETNETIDSLNIDAIQKTLDKHMEGAEVVEQEENVQLLPTEEMETDFSENSPFNLPNQGEELPPLVQTVKQEVDPKSKKYVIYIDPENVEFMENLSIGDRKTIINNILREQDELIAKQKQEEERRKFLTNVIVAVMTVIIGFPILYSIVNKSLEVTLDNYKQSQKNFRVLYREKGKIQPVDYNNGKVNY